MISEDKDATVTPSMQTYIAMLKVNMETKFTKFFLQRFGLAN